MFFAYPLAFSLIALLSSTGNALPTSGPIAQYEMRTPFALSTPRRTVYNPPIISPAMGDHWKIGTDVEVIWFVSPAYVGVGADHF